MVGREMTNRFPPRTPHIGEVSLQVRNWTVYHPIYTERKVVDNVSLTLRAGEVVGIAGLMGAGRTELCMSIFGRAYGSSISGELLIHGKPVHLRDIPQAIEAGLAYVTEDRKGDGLILPDSIKHNSTMARPGFISRHGVIDKDLETMRAKELRQQLGIKTPTVEQLVGNLSGGNQQKVLVNDLVAQGKSVLMVSSELPEILGMCDRIYVMNEGRMIAELDRSEASQESIMSYIMQDSKGEIGA